MSNDTRLQENKKNATCEQRKLAENEPCERESVTHSSNKQMAATESETEKIKKCNKTQIEEDADTVKTKILQSFPNTFSDTLSSKPMKGKPMRIHLDPDINWRPRVTATARQIPLRYQQAADETVADLLQKGVIRKVTKPTKWCSPAFFVPKTKGVRLVTDYTYLNKFVLRPVHPFPSACLLYTSDAADE